MEKRPQFWIAVCIEHHKLVSSFACVVIVVVIIHYDSPTRRFEFWTRKQKEQWRFV